jgi:hypothetical protein
MISKYFLGTFEIVRVGDLEVILIAIEDCHVDPGGAGHGDIIGGVALMRPVRGKDCGKIKGLWGLSAVEPGSVASAGHAPVGPGPERIGDGERRGECGQSGAADFVSYVSYVR